MTSVEEGIHLAVLSGLFLASHQRAGIYHADLPFFPITDADETAADGFRWLVRTGGAAFFHIWSGFDPVA